MIYNFFFFFEKSKCYLRRILIIALICILFGSFLPYHDDYTRNLRRTVSYYSHLDISCLKQPCKDDEHHFTALEILPGDGSCGTYSGHPLALKTLKNSVPVLFIAGHRGSWTQGFTMFDWAHKLLQTQQLGDKCTGLRAFSLDFNSWPSALHGDFVENQAASVTRVIARIKTLYKERVNKEDIKIIVIAHSMGGMVALRALSQNPELFKSSIASIIFLNSPLQPHQFTMGVSHYFLYRSILHRFTKLPKDFQYHTYLLSITSGSTDDLVFYDRTFIPAALKDHVERSLEIQLPVARNVYDSYSHVNILYSAPVMAFLAEIITILAQNALEALTCQEAHELMTSRAFIENPLFPTTRFVKLANSSFSSSSSSQTYNNVQGFSDMSFSQTSLLPEWRGNRQYGETQVSNNINHVTTTNEEQAKDNAIHNITRSLFKPEFLFLDINPLLDKKENLSIMPQQLQWQNCNKNHAQEYDTILGLGTLVGSRYLPFLDIENITIGKLRHNKLPIVLYLKHPFDLQVLHYRNVTYTLSIDHDPDHISDFSNSESLPPCLYEYSTTGVFFNLCNKIPNNDLLTNCIKGAVVPSVTLRYPIPLCLWNLKSQNTFFNESSSLLLHSLSMEIFINNQTMKKYINWITLAKQFRIFVNINETHFNDTLMLGYANLNASNDLMHHEKLKDLKTSKTWLYYTLSYLHQEFLSFKDAIVWLLQAFQYTPLTPVIKNDNIKLETSTTTCHIPLKLFRTPESQFLQTLAYNYYIRPESTSLINNQKINDDNHYKTFSKTNLSNYNFLNSELTQLSSNSSIYKINIGEIMYKLTTFPRFIIASLHKEGQQPSQHNWVRRIMPSKTSVFPKTLKQWLIYFTRESEGRLSLFTPRRSRDITTGMGLMYISAVSTPLCRFEHELLSMLENSKNVSFTRSMLHCPFIKSTFPNDDNVQITYKPSVLSTLRLFPRQEYFNILSTLIFALIAYTTLAYIKFRNIQPTILCNILKNPMTWCFSLSIIALFKQSSAERRPSLLITLISTSVGVILAFYLLQLCTFTISCKHDDSQKHYYSGYAMVTTDSDNTVKDQNKSKRFRLLQYWLYIFTALQNKFFTTTKPLLYFLFGGCFIILLHPHIALVTFTLICFLLARPTVTIPTDLLSALLAIQLLTVIPLRISEFFGSMWFLLGFHLVPDPDTKIAQTIAQMKKINNRSQTALSRYTDSIIMHFWEAFTGQRNLDSYFLLRAAVQSMTSLGALALLLLILHSRYTIFKEAITTDIDMEHSSKKGAYYLELSYNQKRHDMTRILDKNTDDSIDDSDDNLSNGFPEDSQRTTLPDDDSGRQLNVLHHRRAHHRDRNIDPASQTREATQAQSSLQLNILENKRYSLKAFFNRFNLFPSSMIIYALTNCILTWSLIVSLAVILNELPFIFALLCLQLLVVSLSCLHLLALENTTRQ